MIDAAPSPKARAKPLATVQVIRGLAAILVVCDHAIASVGGYTHTASSLQFVGFQLGRFGVLVFFVISGFIMVYSCYGADGPKISVSQFAVHRIRRIVPLYWIMTGVVIFKYVLGHHASPGGWPILASMMFLPLSLRSGLDARPLLSQGWTLDYEAFFYLFFAIGLTMKGKRGVYATSALFILLVVTRIGSLISTPPIVLPGWAVFYSQPIEILFVAGMWVGLFVVHDDRKWMSANAALLGSAILFAIVMWYFWSFVNTEDPPPMFEIASYIAATIIVLLCVTCREGRFGRVGAFFVFLGEVSFAIYLTHTIVGGLIATAVLGHSGGAVPFGYFPLVLLAAVGGGVLTHIAVERPLTAALKGLGAGDGGARFARRLHGAPREDA